MDKKKRVCRIIGIASVIALIVAMLLMFTGILSPQVAMPIGVGAPAVGIVAGFIEKTDMRKRSRSINAFFVLRMIFIVGLAVFGLIMLFTRYI